MAIRRLYIFQTIFFIHLFFGRIKNSHRVWDNPDADDQVSKGTGVTSTAC
jgi:hypothetical protein